MFAQLFTKVNLLAEGQVKATKTETLNALRDYFLAQPEMRCFVTNTNGFGHQVSTVNILLRLIAYGYTGNIKLIYDDAEADKPTIQKLAILLPQIVLKPANAAPDPITIANATGNTTVSFVPKSTYAITSQVDFGFTGGYDDGNNLARFAGTNYFLTLQPFQWSKSKNVISQMVGDTISLDDMETLKPQFFNRAYYYADPTISDAQWDDYEHKQNLEDQVEMCMLLLSYLTEDDPEVKNIDLCSVYGISNAFGGLSTLVSSSQNILFNLLCGISYAQDNKPDVFNKPVVVLVQASIISGSYEDLAEFLKGNNVQGVAKTYATTSRLGERVVIMEKPTPLSLTDKILGLKANQILVVAIPGLPPPIFNQMMYASSLPMVFEGKNTANLAINFPKPFFYLAKESVTVYPTLPIGAEVTSPIAKACTDTCFTMQKYRDSWETPATPARELGQFMIDSRSVAANPTTTYFSGLANFYHDELGDKLFLALQAFLAID